MIRWLIPAAIVVSGLAVAVGAAFAAGTVRWQRATVRATRRLGAGPAEPARFTRDLLDGLPAPVARYFVFALTPDQPLVRRARVRQAGSFARRRDAWAPFTAVEDFAIWPPGFVWDAIIRTAPLLGTRVRDSYLGGAGEMRAMLAGLVPIVDQHGTPQLAAGALLRYLAEAAWLPTALLPGAGVRWDAVDDDTARAAITDAGITVWMDVDFGPRGEILRIAAQRHRDVGGRSVLTPWQGSFREYARRDGMMVPLESEVGWVLPEGWFPYFRARNVHVRYEFRSPDVGTLQGVRPGAR